MGQTVGLEPGHGLSSPEKTAGEKWEGAAFTFCKAATIILFTGRFALPIAAGMAALLYAAAYSRGKRDTRCVLRWPLLICGFWGTISVVSLFFILKPEQWRAVLSRFGF